MTTKYGFYPAVILSCLLLPFIGNSQDTATSASPQKGLFDSDSILEITLKGDTRDLLNDRTREPKNYPFRLSYTIKDSSVISIPVEAKTRGRFRRLKENCYYPPILLQFPKSDDKKSSIFKNSTKLKLVMPCQGDEYVVHEWLAYRLYNLVTPKSFSVRLVRAKFVNHKNNKGPDPFYGLLLEDEKQMGKRNGMISIKKGLRPEQTDTSSFLTMAVFEYLIGNTDWSVQYLQNIKLIAVHPGAVPTAVPYDFDMSGIVNSPYARPADELKMYSVRERRYRGYCIHNLKKFHQAIELYNNRKEEIYSLYNNCPLISAKYKKYVIKFLDEFYTAINDAKEMKKDFEYPCDKYGTGNIVIKGLRDE